jgi:MoxR-like ATPase
MQAIVDVHYPGIAPKLVNDALQVFFELREAPGLKKKPSTSALVDWLKLLMADELAREALYQRDPAKSLPPLAGALIKNEQDTQLLQRLAFMVRRLGR